MNSYTNISDVFDNIMSEQIGGTNIETLIQQPSQFNQESNQQSTQQQFQQQNQQSTQQNQQLSQQQLSQQQFQQPIQQHFQEQTQQQLQEPVQQLKSTKQKYQKQMELMDISKKSLIGGFIFILLSIPQVAALFDRLILDKTPLNLYKIIILKSFIFSILFVILSKLIYTL